MKKLLLSLLPFLLAPLASAQQASERQFVGEVVAVDVEGKTLTVKASQLDAKGERVEKTLTLPVEEPALKQLESITSGDKVTVLWRKDEASQRDTVLKVSKSEASKEAPAPPEKP